MSRMSHRQRRGGVAIDFAPANAVGRALMTFMAVVAVLLQTFVVQTHVHGSGGFDLSVGAPIASTASRVGQFDQPPRAATDQGDKTPCIICQTLATAGATVLAADPPLVSALGVIAHEARLNIPVVPRPVSHLWQSRAPPTFLNA